MVADDLSRLVADIDKLRSELDGLRNSLSPDCHVGIDMSEQATLLAGTLERARHARRAMDLVYLGVAEAALDRGATPRMIDWTDGRAGP